MSLKEFNEIINECKRFSRNEIGDQALESDLTRNIEWSQTIWKKSCQLDLPALLIPDEFNGAGQPDFCCALVLDTLASECAGIASIFANHFACCLSLNHAAKMQKELYLPAMANGADQETLIATVVFPSDTDTEPLILEEKNGGFLLKGKSQLTGNAGITRLLCVFANEPNRNAISCVIVNPDAKGVVIDESPELPGLKANPFSSIIFQDVEIASESIIGEQGQSDDLMKITQDKLHGFVAAMAVGAARTAYQKAFTYAKERYQFGKIIINHQEIQRMLGNMLMKLNMGTSGFVRLFNEEKLNLSHSQTEAALIKAYCTDAALEIAIDAIQIHGGYGYMHEYGVEKIMRDVKVLQLLGGSSPRCHIDVISKSG